MILKKRFAALLAALLFSTLFLVQQWQQLRGVFWAQQQLWGPEWPANATLGFGAVLAVSGPDSPRRSALLQAANVTGLELTVPDQPRWTEEHVDAFNKALEPTEQGTGRGSVFSWLSHANAVQWFLDSGLETALIIEDDVDWDIHLRSVQIPAAAASTRDLLASSYASDSSSSSRGGNRGYYWGNPAAWDVLWVGHCGDWFQEIQDGIGRPGFHAPSNLTTVGARLFNDSSLPTRADLHPFTRDFFDALQVPEGMRFVHNSILPLCTFGYAINRPSAQRLLSEIANSSAPLDPAFDMAMMHGCKYKGLRCYTVNPELFHHVLGDSLIAAVDQREEIFPPPVDAAGFDQTRERNETSNVACGFWSGDFAFDSAERLEVLREEVGRKGRCLKPGREGMPPAVGEGGIPSGGGEGIPSGDGVEEGGN
ncbi:glycosyltransferase family 25 protein [Aplosporella prunicola CBS 121167]|uniref:Glycosyltransferase family 25 protein n=1 Tax=Aplosporella prunicola CBS 121167 TaxID=1176127 RepID=A0A6A6BLR6_9PEZI|nr:glycosyltransferase family 25 protein [Aplosporella prunicola CBS 121167]KAF2143491.1 glycosyltransferase family 25 protein [Aplosporella prunicola CBS 121167]